MILPATSYKIIIPIRVAEDVDFRAVVRDPSCASASLLGNYLGSFISSEMSLLMKALSSTDWKNFPPIIVTLALSGLALLSLTKRGSMKFS